MFMLKKKVLDGRTAPLYPLRAIQNLKDGTDKNINLRLDDDKEC